MAQKVADLMTRDPVTLNATATVREAAKEMKQRDLGDVIVLKDGKLSGIVTDRDIVVRTVAEGRDPEQTELASISSSPTLTVSPEDSVDRAVKIMRDKALRRLPVVDGDKPVGVVSIGDLAMERDPNSALADISSAPSNR